MTKRFIVPAVITWMVVLTSLSGVAQAQSVSARIAPKVCSRRARGRTEPGGGVDAQFVDPNRFFTGVCTVGPRTGDVLFRCYNLGFTNASPRLVQLPDPQ